MSANADVAEVERHD